jgi:long-chain fatty acid transport protein
MQLDGFSDLSIPPSFPLPIPSARSDSFKLRIPLPPTTSLSIYHDMTPCWALMGTIAYDQWSVLKNYYAQNYQSLLGVLPAVYVPQSMHNTFDVSIGTHYKFNPLWMLRANMKYEPTPTQTQYRDLNFPDGTKLGFQIGARYQMTPKVALDMLYGHVFVRTANINTVQPVTFVSPVGYNRTSIDVFGAQLVWNV